MNCPICLSNSHTQLYQDKMRPYFLCGQCSLIYVPREFLLSAENEKKRYDTHQNSESDLRYREYLSKTTSSVVPFLRPRSIGLDFGCGASTLMAEIFEESNLKVDSYDLYYHPDEKIWKNKYDFIVLSEVIEHLSDPLETMQRLKPLLNPEGQFFIKTNYYPESVEAFHLWFYKNDPTHVQFFDVTSMTRLTGLLKMEGPMALTPDLQRLWTID